tara:strand:- start:2297 stop:3277 length:981 start_codon:yes stop_codon:yes gene_type:complete
VNNYIDLQAATAAKPALLVAHISISPNMNNKPMYFEMPNFDTPPESLVRLGQIIHDFEKPTDVVAPPPPHPSLQHSPTVYTMIQSDWESNKRKLVAGSVGVWTQFLASVLGLGADVSLLLERGQADIFKFDKLETSFIEPDLDYVRAAMASPEAVRFYQDNPRKPAFIVTGIKIARGAAIERLKRRKYGAEGNAGADSTPIVGAPVTLGPSGTLGRGVTSSTKFLGSSDFVFAYRLKKIIKDRSNTVSGVKDHVKGAVHGLEDDDAVGQGGNPSKDLDTKPTFEVTGLQAEDFGLELLYADYRIANVDDAHDGSEGETARVLIKNV